MSDNKIWKQERPSWCPHPDCLFVRRAMDAICVGHLPEPVVHDGDFNIHRFCLNGASDSGGVFDLQINNTDIWWFRQMFSALDGKAVEQLRALDSAPPYTSEELDIITNPRLNGALPDPPSQ